MNLYRPQYAYPDPPEGFQEEDFVYFFDQSNTPPLGNVPINQPISRVILQLQPDAPFNVRAIQISGNAGNLLVRFYDAHDNPLSQIMVEADRSYSGSENGAQPIGRLPVVLEPEIRGPAGGFLQVDLELVSP
jgi:hypothetical protein